jgi:hypothetical protein
MTMTMTMTITMTMTDPIITAGNQQREHFDNDLTVIDELAGNS